MGTDIVIMMSVLGFLLGMLINELHHMLFGAVGVLKIDHTNPEKDIYRFEVDDLDGLSKKKHVTLKVVHNADLSQK